MKQERFAWFVGIDWGSERHHACLVASEGIIIAEREFLHSGTGLVELTKAISALHWYAPGSSEYAIPRQKARSKPCWCMRPTG